jgi:hypothetical protein
MLNNGNTDKDTYCRGDKMANNNHLLIPNIDLVLDEMKQEIAQEFGVQLGADTTSRANGSVGGEMVKRLVAMAQEQLGGFKKA